MSKKKLVKNNSDKMRVNQDSPLFIVKGIVLATISIILSIYMLIIIGMMPYYNTNGYSSIGSDKSMFFLNVSVNFVKFLVPLFFIYAILNIVIWVKGGKECFESSFQEFVESISLTDIFAVGFGVISVISYLCSSYKEVALWGSTRWYMGLVSQLLFVGIYFTISRFWKRSAWIPMVFLPASVIVFGMGYLNRFSIFPLDFGEANVLFISTIGNINWYCGYLVILVFGAVAFYWNAAQLKLWQKYVLYIYLGISFGTLVTHGSSSGILALIGILFTLFLLSAKNGERMNKFLEICLILSLVCTFTFFLRLLFPQAFNYEELTTDLLTYSPLPVVMLVFSFIALWWVRKRNSQNNYPVEIMKTISYVIAGLGAVGFLGVISLITINTLKPGGIGGLSGSSFFTFDSRWGSNRGATWIAGVQSFQEQGFLKKLIGVGPDGFESYIYNHGSQELLDMLAERFGSLRLTNAHNEWLNMLVNVGLLGSICYAGMFISGIVRYIKRGMATKGVSACILCAGGLGLLAYCINNMVSFQQSMGTATVFIVFGISEAYMRAKKDEQ